MELAAREGDRLALATELVGEATEQRPLLWQGWMLQGTLTYLQWSRTGDPRLFSDQEAWEQPLRVAMSLAPNYNEPRQMLAGALLETWPALSPERRDEAVELLRDAFSDQATFGRLIRGWLQVAGPDQVYEIIPDTPDAWTTILRSLASARDWGEYRQIYWHHRRALERQLAASLAQADALLRGGDPRAARTTLLGVVDAAPADHEFTAIVDRALVLLPAGAGDRSRSGGVQRWLELALESFAEGEPMLSSAAVGRLARLAGELAPADAALAELAAGNLAGAELYERRTEALNTEPWSAYCVAKARVLLERGDRHGAERMLRVAHPAWRHAPPGRALARRLEVSGSDSFETGRRVVEEGTAVVLRTEWRWRGQRAFLWIEVPRPVSAVSIGVDQAPRGGAVVGVRLGRSLTAVEEALLRDEIVVRRALEVGFYLLEFVPLVGGRVVPGDVRLTFSGG